MIPTTPSVQLRRGGFRSATLCKIERNTGTNWKELSYSVPRVANVTGDLSGPSRSSPGLGPFLRSRVRTQALGVPGMSQAHCGAISAFTPRLRYGAAPQNRDPPAFMGLSLGFGSTARFRPKGQGAKMDGGRASRLMDLLEPMKEAAH
jgi:hypothetical protein